VCPVYRQKPSPGKKREGDVTTVEFQGIPSLSGNIEVKNLSIGYPGITILDKINFNIR
jgi:ABC-type multidrug transport system fused ATPase/permease subunit